MEYYECKVSRYGTRAWGVNVPAAIAGWFDVDREYTVVLGNEETSWVVPPSFHGRSPSGRLCRHIVRAPVRDWLRSNGWRGPGGGVVLLQPLGSCRVRLALSRKELSQHQQKDSEKAYLEPFLSTIGAEPDEIRPDEPPDFWLTLDGRRVAVEMTEHHSDATDSDGRPLRAFEEAVWAYRNAFRAQQPMRKDLRMVFGELWLKSTRAPRKRQLQAFIEELFCFARRAIRDMEGGEQSFGSFGPDFLLLGEYLEELRLSFRGPSGIMWDMYPHAAHVGLTEAEFRSTICRKLSNERPTGCAEHWLLVVSGDGFSQSMGRDLEWKLRGFDSLNRELSTGPFDKVWVYQYMLGSAYVWDRQQGWLEFCPPRAGRR